MMNSTAVRTFDSSTFMFSRTRGGALALADEAEQQMLGPDVVVVEALGLILREVRPSAQVGELVESVHGSPGLP